jgi:hypothetical protein
VQRRGPADAGRWASFQYGWDMNYIIFIFIFSSIIALLHRLHRVAESPLKKMEQAERDRLAQKIAEETERRLISGILSGDDISPFALYLRPFALETVFREYPEELILPHTALVPLSLRRKVNFDFILLEYFNALDMTLISIGAPNDKEGAGHVLTTDALWQERFHQLAKRATTIVVVPGIQPGIMAEIRWLRWTPFLAKAIFFKPKEYPKADWEIMQETYKRKEGIGLPDYSPSQLAFRLYQSGGYYQLWTWRRRVDWLSSKERERINAMFRAFLTNKPIGFD